MCNLLKATHSAIVYGAF